MRSFKKINRFDWLIKSMWAGRYSHTLTGVTSNFLLACLWLIKFSIIEYFRVLKLNKWHYGNILGSGDKKTDKYGRKIK